MLAAAVLLAPSATLACEIACARSDAGGAAMEMDAAMMAMAGDMPGCHHVARSDNGPVAGPVHPCTHVDGLPTTFADRAVTTAPPPVSSLVLPLASLAVNGPTAWRPLARPPDRAPRPTPLRI